MLMPLATTAGLAVWIVLWATGTKSFDAFMITLVMLVLAIGVKMLLPYRPGKRS